MLKKYSYNSIFKPVYILLVAISISLILQQESVSNNIDSLIYPKNNAYRIGTTDKPEKEYKISKDININATKKINISNLKNNNKTFADLTLKNISQEIYSDLDLKQEEIISDLQILWLGAAMRSESMKFAIYKLSSPDNDKPNDTLVKKIIRPLVNMSALAGLGISDPIIGTAAIASGSLLSQLSINDKELNYKYSKVNDADMVILMRKIDNLQKNLTSKYFDYMVSKELLNNFNNNLANRNKRVDFSLSQSKAHTLIADAYLKTAIDRYEFAKSDFLFKRSALEQIVGSEALKQFEDNLKSRQTANKK